MSTNPTTTENPTTIEIRHRWNNAVLFAAEAAFMKAAVIAACRAGADLAGANLAGADLARANLARANLAAADLSGANLAGADLSRANLAGANLAGANLARANLARANLAGADLARANLAGVYLAGANLAGADLAGARINWSSHALIAEVLRREAGLDVEKRKFAGLVAISRDWCWSEFLALSDPMLGWALDHLATLIIDGDDAPSCLTSRRASPAARVDAGEVSP